VLATRFSGASFVSGLLLINASGPTVTISNVLGAMFGNALRFVDIPKDLGNWEQLGIMETELLAVGMNLLPADGTQLPNTTGTKRPKEVGTEFAVVVRSALEIGANTKFPTVQLFVAGNSLRLKIVWNPDGINITEHVEVPLLGSIAEDIEETTLS
jgi:hypothetical protein